MVPKNNFDQQLVFTTTDPARARVENSAQLRAHTLRVLSDSPRFLATHHVVRWPTVSIHCLTFGGPVEIGADADALADHYLVSIPIRGTSRIVTAGPSGTPTTAHSDRHHAAIVHPRAQFRSIWSADCTKFIVKIDGPALRDHTEHLLRRRLDDEPRFAPRLDLRGEPALWWHLLRAYLAAAGREDSASTHGPLSISVQQSLMTTLLTTHENNYRRELLGIGNTGLPPHIAHAVDVIHRDPAQVGGVAELAREAGVSVRTLQEGFARHLHSTPSRYLRRARLWRAHADLLAADPARRGAVTEAATHWGFANLGRFAKAYREEFGHDPSETAQALPPGAAREENAAAAPDESV